MVFQNEEDSSERACYRMESVKAVVGNVQINMYSALL